MAKQVSVQFVCNNCGSVSLRWHGQCLSCQAWNSLVQDEQIKVKSIVPSRKTNKEPIPLVDVKILSENIIPTDIIELDRVLGKGLVEGSVILLGGEPGIGKSTLALQAAQHISAVNKNPILYVSGEESEQQIFMRSKRIGQNSSNLLVLCEIDVISIRKTIERQAPKVVILDSIQVIHHRDIPSTAGSVNQVRQCAWELISIAKEKNISIIIIGHITKDGTLAGPKVLEHMVDIILFFEGDRNQKYRLLRCFKNRYSNTDEIGLFEMTQVGLTQVNQIADLFIDSETLSNPGSMVVPILQGCRVMLVEVQSLVVDSGYGMAKRTFTGVDPGRANMIIAAMEKSGRFKLVSKDIFLNIIGGLKVSEPGLDLGIVLAIVSSIIEKPLSERMGVIGEVGLTGEIRSVTHLEKRVLELEKMGFTHCILPSVNKRSFPSTKIEPIFVKNVNEAIAYFLD